MSELLLSSNLLALCFSRLRIQISRDTPDNDAAPPAATPDATAATGVGEAWQEGFSAVQLPWTSQVTRLSPFKVKSWSHLKEHLELNVGSGFEQLMCPFSGASSSGHVTAVQVGGADDHWPSFWHVILLAPWSSWPLSQSKVQTIPSG